MKRSFSGNSLYPLLVAVPLGLTLWTIVSDIIYLKSANLVWFLASFCGGIGVVISALVAAVPGVGDLLTVARRNGALRIGILHMIGNLVAVALFAVAAFLATAVDVTTGSGFGPVVLLHSIAVITIGIAAWLGAEMMSKYQLAVHEPEPRGRSVMVDSPPEKRQSDVQAEVAALPFTPLTRAR